MSKRILKLKVVEAFQDDVNKGILRIDSGFMKEINAKAGDIVKIKGGKETVGIVDRAYPGDIGLNIIRMDGLMRRNAIIKSNTNPTRVLNSISRNDVFEW